MSQITISNSAGSVLMSSYTGSLSWSSGVNNVISVNSDLIEFTELLS